jgi:acyl-coenzyme A synthetase/AMP-(fatty) acid ligase
VPGHDEGAGGASALGAADLSSLRALWAGSSLLPAPLIEAFHARGVPVCNVYGATESGPFSIAVAAGARVRPRGLVRLAGGPG